MKINKNKLKAPSTSSVTSSSGMSLMPPRYGLPSVDSLVTQRKGVLQFGAGASRPVVKKVMSAEGAELSRKLDSFSLQLLLKNRQYLTHGTDKKTIGMLEEANVPQEGTSRTNPAADSAVFALNDWRNTYGRYIIFYRKTPLWRSNKHDPLTYLQYGKVDPDQAIGWARREDVEAAYKAMKRKE